jgi:hypothetical protein
VVQLHLSELVQLIPIVVQLHLSELVQLIPIVVQLHLSELVQLIPIAVHLPLSMVALAGYLCPLFLSLSNASNSIYRFD